MLAAFDMALIVLDYRSNGYGVAASINNPRFGANARRRVAP